MAHNLTFNSLTGKYELMTRGAAWHNLGQVVKDCKSWEETMELAGLDWTISKRPLEYHGIQVPAWGIFRDDIFEPEKAFLSSCSETYTPIQNHFMFAFLDALVESEGAHYEAAGSLNGGAEVFALVNLGTAFELSGGDRIENYLLFTDSRVPGKSADCFVTAVRVVCANTLEQALSKQDCSKSVKFRHTANIHDKMGQAVDLFTGGRMTVGILQQKLERLAERRMTRPSMVAILDRLFPVNEEAKSQAKRDDKLTAILERYEINDGDIFPEQRGTAYNFLNALTEWADHFSPVVRTSSRIGQTDEEIRSERALFGSYADLKANALDTILEETAYNPTKRVAYSTPAGAVQTVELEREDYGNLLDNILDEA